MRNSPLQLGDVAAAAAAGGDCDVASSKLLLDVFFLDF